MHDDHDHEDTSYRDTDFMSIASEDVNSRGEQLPRIARTDEATAS